ncbi:MAG TPA: DUF502 domain-containing protein [Polyangiaceae bacterium]|nr:DUF502 domain-containing protein [Polyangiaceae bacterium]
MSVKRLVRYFLRGCLVTAPLGLTVYVVWLVLSTIDRLLPLPVPGLGLVATLVLITAIGVATSNVVGRTVVEMADSLFGRLPLVKLVYTSIKDLVDAFVGDKRRFDVPVAVTLSGTGAKALGFVTRGSLGRLGMPDSVAVYFPQSYNFAGYLLVVPRQQVEPLDVPAAELMTFIISGGVSGFGVGQSILPPQPLGGAGA